MKNLILSALFILTAASCEKKTTETGDTQTVNPAQLKYEGHTLKSVDCTDFEKNFKSK